LIVELRSPWIRGHGQPRARCWVDENFDSNNIDPALSVCPTEVEIIDPGMGASFGKEPFREYLEAFKRAMPDAHALIDHRANGFNPVPCVL
jgi:hypothetical protein